MREISIFLIILVVLSLGMHPDFFTQPIQRVTMLPTSGAYGIGAFHPLVFTLAIYLVFIFVRSITRVIKKVFIK